MSYFFNRDGYFFGDFGSGVLTNYTPYTIAFWFKQAAHPSNNSHMFARFSSDSSGSNNYHSFRNSATLDQYQLTSHDGTLFPSATIAASASRAGLWTPIIGTIETASSRRISIIGETDGTNSTTLTMTAAPRYFRVASGNATPASSGVANTNIAEIAIWNVALDSSQRAEFIAGTPPSEIAAANLIGYWPLAAANTTQIDASGNAGPSLALTGDSVYDAAHPPVTAARNVPQVSPLYYGTTLLENKTNITWYVTGGHDTPSALDFIRSGTAGTTDASGNFIFVEADGSFGEVSDPVTLHLYWEEGSDPTIVHSVIHKTTLIAAA